MQSVYADGYEGSSACAYEIEQYTALAQGTTTYYLVMHFYNRENIGAIFFIILCSIFQSRKLSTMCS